MSRQTRYIPFTQQPYLCVAACIQMIMYKNDIPLIAQEDIANALGLIVPKKDAHFFDKAKTADKPSSSGWGTQIQNPKYNPNVVFSELGIPLRIKRRGIADIQTQENLKKLLQDIQSDNDDAMLCFDYLDGDTLHMVDPERNVPKHRQVSIEKLFDAINFHGDGNATGVWVLERI